MTRMMTAAFDPKLDLPKTETTFTYIILSQPRTGSHMVTSALAGSGCAGVPDEYFNWNNLMQLPQPLSLSTVKRYYQDVVSRRTSPNGVFGMKLHHIQFQKLFMDKDTVTSDGLNFIKSFDRVILLSRRDKIAQAMSNIRAARTGQWTSDSKSHAGEHNYEFTKEDAPAVLNFIRTAVEGELAWNAICERLNLNPLRVVYEELSQFPEAELKRVVAHLGLPEIDIAPQSVKQSRDSNMKSKREFLNALGVEWNTAD